MATKEVNTDPYANFYFQLFLTFPNDQEIEVAHFLECSGLKCSTTIFEIEEGGLNGTTHKRKGQTKWENLVLKNATSASTVLLEWVDRYNRDEFDTASATTADASAESTGKAWGKIVMWGSSGADAGFKVVRRYTFKNAWPVSWEGPSLNANSASALAIESIEIAHEGLKIDNGE